MEEVVKKNVLDAIHFILKLQRQYIDEDKMKKADELIIPYVENNFEYDKNEFKVKVFGAPVLVNDKRIFPIVIRYYAIVQDNLSLLSKLEEENYSFKGIQHVIKFYALDKQLSNKFKEKDYIRYLKKNDDCIEHFYNTLRGLNHHEREVILKEFSEIVKADPTVLEVGKEDDEFFNFLTRRNIEYFGKDFLLSLDDKQRKLVNSFYFQVDDSNISKIKELVIKYPDFKMPIPLYVDILNMFTVDEIGTMSDKDIELYAVADKKHLLPRMKELLEINPSFDCPKEFINKDIFWLTNEEILDLDWETMEEISKIKRKELNDGTFVIPVNKMRATIDKSKENKNKNELKKKVDGIIEKIDVFHRK